MEDSTINDLAIGRPFISGQKNLVNNCWHFYTDGTSVELFFNDKESFIFGMNLIYFLSKEYGITILAFVLMETHVHFIIYGNFVPADKFIHEYIREMSIHTRIRLGYKNPLKFCKTSYQKINDDQYLKKAICYVLRNPLVAGMPFSPLDYPWGSGALYFRNAESWCNQQPPITLFKKIRREEYYRTYSTKRQIPEGTQMIGLMIHPSEYVNIHLVEQIFRTHKSFYYHLGRAREDEIEAMGGTISNFTIPLREMRQNKRDTCMELFGTEDIRKLGTRERIRLARVLKSRYNSSPKQIARLCGLIYAEVCQII